MNKHISILITLSLIGLLVGVFLVYTNDIGLEYSPLENISKVRQFINLFTINYWYLCLMWVLKINPITRLLNYFILFFKSITIGIIFGILLKSYALYGIGMFLVNWFGQIIIIYPLMFYLMLVNSNCQKQILIVTLVTCIYSFVVTLL